MIPNALEGWNIEVVQGLLVQGVFESDRFDFKETLPNAKAETEKLRLRKACISFANSDGGYLIFGVKDDKGLEADDRMVGLDPTFDFPEAFGSYPGACEPPVEWEFKNPAVVLPSGRLIHVVKVRASSRRPHALWDQERWWFCKRTSKGTEVMSYEEVRLAFQDTEFRRSKLSLLRAEIENIDWIGRRLLEDIKDDSAGEGLAKDAAWLTRYPTTVVDTVLGDTFSLFGQHATVWTALTVLRDHMRRSNAFAEVYSSYDFIRSSADPQQRRKLYRQMREFASDIRANVKICDEELVTILGGTV